MHRKIITAKLAISQLRIVWRALAKWQETLKVVKFKRENKNDASSLHSELSLLRRGFYTAKIKATEASARFLTQYGVEPGGGVIQTIYEEYNTENDIWYHTFSLTT